jgi:hypothetical protein
MSFDKAYDSFFNAGHYARELDLNDNEKGVKVNYYDGLAYLASGFENLEKLLSKIEEKLTK